MSTRRPGWVPAEDCSARGARGRVVRGSVRPTSAKHRSESGDESAATRLLRSCRLCQERIRTCDTSSSTIKCVQTVADTWLFASYSSGTQFLVSRQTEVDMAKSTSLTAAQINKLLKLNPDWIKDPVPPLRKNLDQATLRKIAQAKVAFGKEINNIVRNQIGRASW